MNVLKRYTKIKKYFWDLPMHYQNLIAGKCLDQAKLQIHESLKKDETEMKKDNQDYAGGHISTKTDSPIESIGFLFFRSHGGNNDPQVTFGEIKEKKRNIYTGPEPSPPKTSILVLLTGAGTHRTPPDTCPPHRTIIKGD